MYAGTTQGELKKRTLDKDDLLGLCTSGGGEGEVPSDEQGGCRIGGDHIPDALCLGLSLLLFVRWRR